jgi:hypothetical protein
VVLQDRCFAHFSNALSARMMMRVGTHIYQHGQVDGRCDTCVLSTLRKVQASSGVLSTCPCMYTTTESRASDVWRLSAKVSSDLIRRVLGSGGRSHWHCDPWFELMMWRKSPKLAAKDSLLPALLSCASFQVCPAQVCRDESDCGLEALACIAQGSSYRRFLLWFCLFDFEALQLQASPHTELLRRGT